MSILPFLDPEHLASFLTLVFLEIVLAGDNLVLIAVLSSRLPEAQRPLARRFGLLAAVATRLLLLVSLFWLSHLETPIALDQFGLNGMAITPRQIVLGVGGLFLLLKSLTEIANFFKENGSSNRGRSIRPASGIFLITVIQIAIFDIIFSLDSVVAAIGIARHVEVMASAIIVAALVMFFLVNPISNFIERFPSIKLIALNFLALIGIILIAEALHIEIARVYYYLGLAVVVVIQLATFWFVRQSGAIRWMTTIITVALAAALALGAYHASTNEPSMFRDLYLSILSVLDELNRELEGLLSWMKR